MPKQESDEELYQLPKEELVKIIQALRGELERLKEIVNKDSKSSSKPPSHTANLLTVVQTCRSQKRNVFDFLASAIHAHTRNQIIFPSLIPLSAT